MSTLTNTALDPTREPLSRTSATPSWIRTVAGLLLVVWTLATGYALIAGGWSGLVQFFREGTAWTLQALVDLVVALVAGALFVLVDARRTGRKAAPWVLLTFTTGALGLVLYLVAGSATARELRDAV